MTRTTLHITDEQRERLVEMSKARGVSVSELVRHATDEYIARNADGEWERGVNAAFGIMPELPDGEEYTRQLRDAWAERSAERIAGL